MPWDAPESANARDDCVTCCTGLVKHNKALIHLKNDLKGLTTDFAICCKPDIMDVEHWPYDRTSEADAFDNDDATTLATVALAAELELADPPGAPPFGFGAFFAAAAFGAALGSW